MIHVTYNRLAEIAKKLFLLLCLIWGAKRAIQHKNGLIIMFSMQILYVVFNIVLITAVATCADTKNKQKLLKLAKNGYFLPFMLDPGPKKGVAA